jgi:hypothetical protein
VESAWSRAGIAAAAFAVVLATGFWLARRGRPYGTLLLTVHKLLCVGILVFLGAIAFATDHDTALEAGVWLVVSLAAVAFVVTIASGGVVSAMESPPPIVSVLHKVAPYAALLLGAASFYTLLWRTT